LVEAVAAPAVANGRSATRPWAAVGVLGRATWSPSYRIFFEAEAGAILPLVRDRFFLEPRTTIEETPTVGLMGNIGTGVRFY
jgi:hypothetical protein